MKKVMIHLVEVELPITKKAGGIPREFLGMNEVGFQLLREEWGKREPYKTAGRIPESFAGILEMLYEDKRNHARTHEEKVEYDRVRALMKYTDTAGGRVYELRRDKKNKKLTVAIAFDDIGKFNHFVSNVDQCVDAATMK